MKQTYVELPFFRNNREDQWQRKRKFPCCRRLIEEVLHERQHSLYHTINRAFCFSKRVKPIWEKPGAEVGNTASIVTVPDGGPRAGWTPASQRSALVGPSLNRPRSVLPGENRRGVPQLTQTDDGPGAAGLGGFFLNPILISGIIP